MDGGAEGGKRKVEEKRVSEKAARVGGSRRVSERRVSEKRVSRLSGIAGATPPADRIS